MVGAGPPLEQLGHAPVTPGGAEAVTDHQGDPAPGGVEQLPRAMLARLLGQFVVAQHERFAGAGIAVQPPDAHLPEDGRGFECGPEIANGIPPYCHRGTGVDDKREFEPSLGGRP